MDESLFKKHLYTIKKNKDSKEELRTLIQEKLGISLDDEELNISKKVVIFNVSSVKKMFLLKNDIKSFLKEKGFISKL